MDFFIQLIFISILGIWAFYIGRLGSIIRPKTLLILFLIKLLFAYANWEVYTHYYTDRSTSDIYKYFDDGMLLFQECKNSAELTINFLIENETEATNQIKSKTDNWDRSKDDLFNSNRLIIKIHLLLAFISKGGIHIHIFFFALLSFIGSLLIFHFFHERLSCSKTILLACLFLIPSCTFWSSAMLKESVSVFALGLLLFSYNRILLNKFLGYITVFIFSIFVLYETKPIIIICIGPALAFLFMIDREVKFNYAFAITQIPIIGFALLFYSSISSMIIQKHNEFVKLGINEKANSLANQEIYNGIDDLVINIPNSLLNLFRPTILEISSVFDSLSAIENIFLIIAFFLIFWKLKHIIVHPIRLFILIFCFYYLIVLALTVPILGALVRYKSIILPFVFLISLSDESIRKRIGLST